MGVGDGGWTVCVYRGGGGGGGQYASYFLLGLATSHVTNPRTHFISPCLTSTLCVIKMTRGDKTHRWLKHGLT